MKREWERRATRGLIAAVVILVYLPGLPHGFVYDDHGAIEEN